ncbi:MAG: ribonuclease P protein component [Planctomycetes bacterium]|nr:ribonuclease P protein component [Planctomycetota bacterium]
MRRSSERSSSRSSNRSRPTTGTDPIEGFGLPRLARLRRASEFRRVYGRGARAGGAAITVVAFARRNPGHRVGVSVSKEHGPAVRRNKIKRILREAFRLERPSLPGRFDLILIPRPSPEKFALEDVRRDLRELVAKIAAGKGRRRRGRR